MAASLLRKRSRDTGDMLNGVMWRQILTFFFPILIGSFFQQLYNMVDTIVIGKTVGTNALAAVGTTGNIITLLVGLFVGIAGGATVVISQYYGARDAAKVHNAVHTAIAMGILFGAVMMVIGIITTRPLLKIMNVPEEIIDDAATYMIVYYAGIIGNMLYNVGTGVLRSVGDSRTPLLVLIVCCMANIVLDILFVVGFHWDVFGVAFATIISQLISAVCVIFVLMKAEDIYQLKLKEIRFDFKLLKEIVRIGIPSGMESVFYAISNALLQASINGFGTIAIASWTAISKVDAVVWMVMQAFAISVSTIVGQNFGGKCYDRVKECSRTGLWMTLGSVAFVSACLWIFGTFFLKIFTDDPNVVTTGVEFLHVLAPSYILYVFINNYSSVIRGCGESLQPMLITGIFICGIRIAWLLGLLPMYRTVSMVALCYPASWLVTAGIFIVYYLRMRWMKRCIAHQQQLELQLRENAD